MEFKLKFETIEVAKIQEQFGILQYLLCLLFDRIDILQRNRYFNQVSIC